jgi:hypothetical protein
VRLVAGFGGIMIVVLTAPGSAIGGAAWAVAAFCVAPILWAAGSLLTANAGRPVDRVVASAVQLLAGGTVLLLVALSLGELDPTRWSDVSWTSAGAAVFLFVFDSLVGFMLYTRLLESAPAPLVSTYAYITPLVGAVIGATVLDEPLWAGAFVGGALVLGAVALELRGPMRPRPSRWDGPAAPAPTPPTSMPGTCPSSDDDLLRIAQAVHRNADMPPDQAPTVAGVVLRAGPHVFRRGPDHRTGGGVPEFVLRAGWQDFGGCRGQAGGRAVPAQPIRHGNAFHRDTSPLRH